MSNRPVQEMAMDGFFNNGVMDTRWIKRSGIREKDLVVDEKGDTWGMQMEKGKRKIWDQKKNDSIERSMRAFRQQFCFP